MARSMRLSPFLALLAAGLAGCSSAPPAAPAVREDPRFAWFQGLPGTWVATEESSQPGTEVSYRLTAGGSVLVETIRPLGEEEMMSTVHREGDGLLLTHFCSLGNQPRLRASAEPAPEGERSVDFRCTGGSNVREDGMHMHRAVFTFVGDDRLQAAWTLVDGGETVEVARMDLVRIDGGRS